jgi:hypothetical protein
MERSHLFWQGGFCNSQRKHKSVRWRIDMCATPFSRLQPNHIGLD